MILHMFSGWKETRSSIDTLLVSSGWKATKSSFET